MAIRRAPVVALFALTLTACTSPQSSSPPAEQLPDGKAVLVQSASAMSTTKSAHFTLKVDGELPGVNVKSARGDLTSAGEAKGTAQIVQFGQLTESEFVLAGDTLYLKGPTGGWQQLPIALVKSIFDPAVFLNPERGLPKVLSDSTEVRTESTETINGTDTYRVGVKVSKELVSGLLPGIGSDVTGKLWIRKQDPKQLVRARFEVPGEQGKPGSTATLDLSDFDKSVTITPPA